jgi:hypothetical protein
MLSRNRIRIGRVIAALVLTLIANRVEAQEATSDDVEQRLHFIENRLQAEAVQARAWEGGWAIVDVAGFGYGLYQIGSANSHPARVDGLIGASKSVIGVVGVALGPLHASQGAHPLDTLSEATLEEQEKKLAMAEKLLLRNAEEADIRFSWKPHVISLALNIVGGVIVWASGDFRRGAESAAIGSAVGELTILTRPWKPKKDLSDYRRQFGGLAAGAESTTQKPASVALRVGPTGMQLAF